MTMCPFRKLEESEKVKINQCAKVSLDIQYTIGNTSTPHVLNYPSINLIAYFQSSFPHPPVNIMLKMFILRVQAAISI